MFAENECLFGSESSRIMAPHIPIPHQDLTQKPRAASTDARDTAAAATVPLALIGTTTAATVQLFEANQCISDSDTAAAELKRLRHNHERLARDVQLHPLLPPCECKKNCIRRVPEERRVIIHSEFWNMEYNSRKAWIFSHVKLSDTKRRRSESKGFYARSCTRFYMLPTDGIENAFVCKTFFMRTLGFTADKAITTALSPSEDGTSRITVPSDMRGRHVPSNKIADQVKSLIQQHIESYHPSVSHYRREHAPLRRYLAPEITITDMHENFITKYPEHKCSYEFYRSVVSSMNISFVKLGEEECEVCLEHELHNRDCSGAECQSCRGWDDHMEAARISRRHYQQDADRKIEDDDVDEAVLSVDMQKVIMLPRLPGVKTCVFTRRLVGFHETFAPLGGKKSSLVRPLGVVWHEGVSGRNAEDIMSCYAKAMRHPVYRDCKRFTFYADNCSAQNKNWTLYTGMVAEVNRIGGPDEVTLKYLEKGHTFMSADSFHAKVEGAVRKMKNLYDFDDFQSAINQHGTAVPMDVSDFSLWENGVSSAKFTQKPVLANCCVVQFRRGSTKIFWKNSMDSDEWEVGDFLKKKVSSALLRGIAFPSRCAARGISQSKKTDIEHKLCALMPEDRKAFWHVLAVNDISEDLIDNQ